MKFVNSRARVASAAEDATLFDFRKGNELLPAAEFLRKIRGL